MLLFMGLVFFGLLLLGTPIGFALGITAVVSLAKMAGISALPALLNPGSDLFIFKMVSQRFYAGLDMFTLMAMPFLHLIISPDLASMLALDERRKFP